MDPIRDPEGIEIEYLDRMADIHSRQVLEIGAGTGRLIWQYVDSANTVVGIDPDNERLATALDDWPQTLETPLLLAQADAQAIPHADEVFGAVLLAWSL
jgi:ubiquinone/menaquinone biosynthesis C-methylase UbiE